MNGGRIGFREWLKYRGITYKEYNDLFASEKQELRQRYLNREDIIEAEIVPTNETEENDT